MKKSSFEVKSWGNNDIYTVNIHGDRITIADPTGKIIHANRDKKAEHTHYYAEAYLNNFLA